MTMKELKTTDNKGNTWKFYTEKCNNNKYRSILYFSVNDKTFKIRSFSTNIDVENFWENINYNLKNGDKNAKNSN